MFEIKINRNASYSFFCPYFSYLYMFGVTFQSSDQFFSHYVTIQQHSVTNGKETSLQSVTAMD